MDAIAPMRYQHTLAPLRSSPQLIEIQNSLFDYRVWIRIVIPPPAIDRCFQRPFSSRNKNIEGGALGFLLRKKIYD